MTRFHDETAVLLMPRLKLAFIITLLCSTATPAAENWIKDGDFESGEAAIWSGGSIEREIVHSGRGALRVDMPDGETRFNARYGPPIELNQSEPETLMLAFWMRFDAQRQTGAIRGGITCGVDFHGEPYLAWYGPFELKPEEAGSWVYREARWKPRSPVAGIRLSAYLKGFEGTVYIDDVYLGPPTDLPVVSRSTIPVAVTGTRGRFKEWPRFEVLQFEPKAHVFHLDTNNQTNLELSCEINVTKTAPAYLSSAMGSQYWTLYCPDRKELAEIYTDERLDLSKPGRSTIAMPMSSFADNAYGLAAGGYVFLTDRFKNFLVYGTEKPKGERYHDPRTGAISNYWDTVRIEPLSTAVGPSGVTAPFSLADLRSYKLSVVANRVETEVRVQPMLRDAADAVVPLYRLELTARYDGKTVRLREKATDDGLPMGIYVFPGEQTPAEIHVAGSVRLATPDGPREERLDVVAKVAASDIVPPRPRETLKLMGWGGNHYDVAQGAECGPRSVQHLIDDAKAIGLSRLVVVVRNSKSMQYPSDVSLGDKPDWDMLKHAVNEGKRAGVDIYAGYVLGIAQPIDLIRRPEWAMLDPKGKQTGWYCYNNVDVRAYHAAQLAEIVVGYDVAGVALDFCRPGGGCFCPRCAEFFERKHGKLLKNVTSQTTEWLAFQRESTTEYIRQLGVAVHMARPDAQFAGYVWGRFAPEKDRAGQDWPRWLKEGTMDWVCVGQYTPSTPMFRSQCRTLKRIADKHLGGDTSRIYPLLGASYIQKVNPSHAAADAVINRHLRAAQEEGLSAAGYFPFSAIRTHVTTDF